MKKEENKPQEGRLASPPAEAAQDNVSGTELLIRFDSVTKIYKDSSIALQGINLDIADGEFISIVGPSGAGKSTLMKLIYAEEMPTEGEVWFNGRAISEISRRKLPLHRRNIGTVFQDSKLLHRKTVFENVAYALEVLGVPTEEIEEDVPQILEIVGMGNMIEKFPEQLSGGEKQKVAMARALIHKPIVIIADEPTGNLDPVSSLEIVDLLLKINELGTTVVLASHDKDIVNKAQKRVLVMDQGKIINDYSKGKYKLI
jgi:cell division transport system ATP-binding protein